MKQIFKTNISLGSYIWGMAMVACIVILGYNGMSQGLYLGTALLFSILVLSWYFTFFFKRYWIQGDKLFIRSISGTKSIAINAIRKLETDQTGWLGTMGLNILSPYRKGIMLYYNQIENLFIYPEKSAEFIDKLQQIKPSIEIIKGK
ncbi:PH domain-containing protein [Sphingobacterium sp. N143]|uniref:PH domain-containing protein n=1 Tax=Sphingobacterium sp. N143 TaxID=2746727 RepID=UPI0025760E77|nr:PH domain-containing protein [Sphingobacterium sp. N143]MDM1293523.1 PH domain-containing protein [Sphingobacterium sp. N143]